MTDSTFTWPDGGGTLIVTYHYVRPQQPGGGVRALLADDFRRQLDWLERAGSPLLTGTGTTLSAAGRNRREPTFLVTFDDGLAEHYTYVAPELERRGYRGVFGVIGFVLTDGEIPFVHRCHLAALSGGYDLLWTRLREEVTRRGYGDPEVWGTLPEDQKAASTGAAKQFKWVAQQLLPPEAREALLRKDFEELIDPSLRDRWFMTAQQTRDLARRGHRLAGHGTSHESSALLSERQLANDARMMRALLSTLDDRFEAEPMWIYPYGTRYDFNDATDRVLHDAGYSLRFSVLPGVWDGSEERTVPRVDCERLPPVATAPPPPATPALPPAAAEDGEAPESHDTYDFVKATARDRYWEARRREREALLDPATGRLRQSILEPADCAICENDEADFLFESNGFRFVRCRTCGLVYSNPRFAEAKALSVYRSSESNDLWMTEGLTSPAQMESDRKKYVAGFDWIERHLTPGRVLDIGCAIGHFLKVGRDRGWEPHGLELNEQAIRIAKERFGLATIKPKPLEEAGFPPGHFDAIGLWGILEHLLHPKAFLRQVHRVLRPTGVVILMTPNEGSLVARVLREQTSCYDGIPHHCLFNRATLGRLLEDLGFEIVEYATVQPELATAWNYLAYRDPYLGKRPEPMPFDRKVRGLIERKICEYGLGYKMKALARKVR